jgi:plastocyanin
VLGSSVAAGGGCHPPSDAATQRSGTSVDIKGCTFGPTVLHTPVGATVTWLNSDVVPHAIAGSGWVAAQDPITQGASASHTFDRAGVYTYMCYVHPGMAGVIVVGDEPFAGASLPATPTSVANTAVASTAGDSPTQLPLAIGLVVGAAIGAAGYRVADGALAIRRRHGVLAR